MPNSYVTIQRFMVDELQLKGNELLVYAIIFGFSQDGQSSFDGSQEYLANWCNTSTRTIRTVLNSLSEKGLIEKGKSWKSTHSYKIKQTENISKKAENSSGFEVIDLEKLSKKAEMFSKKAEIISDNNKYNKDNIDKKDFHFDQIIDYLNSKAGTSFRSSSELNRRRIRARFNDGYELNDFYRVIDYKCSEWVGTDFQKFLCPDTLFGTKFEKYLNQCQQKTKPVGGTYDYPDL